MKIKAMLCATRGSHTSRHQPDKPNKLLFAICKADDDNISKERATKSKYYRTLHTKCKKARCAKRVGGVNVVPDGARSRRWGIVSTAAVCTPRSR
eukprot:2927173-Pleurochrysis_carterae.AAC.1